MDISKVLIKKDDSFEETFFTKEQKIDWFAKNTDDEGNVKEDIILFFDVRTKAVDEAVEFVMSDNKLDRGFERFDSSGWDLKNYRKNPVVLWRHDRAIPSIGKMESVKVKDSELKGKIQFVPKEIDQFSWSIGERVKQGFLTSGSVGFMPSKIELIENAKDGTRLIYRKQELYEFSIVNVPELPSARVTKTEDVKVITEKAETSVFIDKLFDEDSFRKSSGIENLFDKKK